MGFGRTNASSGGQSIGVPKFTYTGAYQIIDDGNGDWRVKLLTSGELIFNKNVVLDVFLVGGGGSGACGGAYHGAGPLL